MKTRARQHGFTLVELLIAMAVFAVMASIAYSGLSSVLSSKEAIDSALDRSKTLQMATWRIQRDMEQIVDRPIRNRFGDVEPPILGSVDLGLTFTRGGWSNPMGEPRSTLQRVHYELDNDRRLVRSYWRVLDQAQDSGTVDSTLLEGVESIEWRYLDGRGQWQDRWPADGSFNASGLPGGSLADAASSAGAGAYNPPQAIELRLDTDTWGTLRLLFMVPGGRPSNASQNAISGITGGAQ